MAKSVIYDCLVIVCILLRKRKTAEVLVTEMFSCTTESDKATKVAASVMGTHDQLLQTIIAYDCMAHESHQSFQSDKTPLIGRGESDLFVDLTVNVRHSSFSRRGDKYCDQRLSVSVCLCVSQSLISI